MVMLMMVFCSQLTARSRSDAEDGWEFRRVGNYKYLQFAANQEIAQLIIIISYILLIYVLLHSTIVTTTTF